MKILVQLLAVGDTSVSLSCDSDIAQPQLNFRTARQFFDFLGQKFCVQPVPLTGHVSQFPLWEIIRGEIKESATGFLSDYLKSEGFSEMETLFRSQGVESLRSKHYELNSWSVTVINERSRGTSGDDAYVPVSVFGPKFDVSSPIYRS